ncbi:unnamed protein product [Amoebophrya sp. A25]|nr:unnamed protein product [Amoebophrya sp. A25]|eukprot:GSA25T00026253001.1
MIIRSNIMKKSISGGMSFLRATGCSILPVSLSRTRTSCLRAGGRSICHLSRPLRHEASTPEGILANLPTLRRPRVAIIGKTWSNCVVAEFLLSTRRVDVTVFGTKKSEHNTEAGIRAGNADVIRSVDPKQVKSKRFGYLLRDWREQMIKNSSGRDHGVDNNTIDVSVLLEVNNGKMKPREEQVGQGEEDPSAASGEDNLDENQHGLDWEKNGFASAITQNPNHRFEVSSSSSASAASFDWIVVDRCAVEDILSTNTLFGTDNSVITDRIKEAVAEEMKSQSRLHDEVMENAAGSSTSSTTPTTNKPGRQEIPLALAQKIEAMRKLKRRDPDALLAFRRDNAGGFSVQAHNGGGGGLAILNLTASTTSTNEESGLHLLGRSTFSQEQSSLLSTPSPRWPKSSTSLTETQTIQAQNCAGRIFLEVDAFVRAQAKLEVKKQDEEILQKRREQEHGPGTGGAYNAHTC